MLSITHVAVTLLLIQLMNLDRNDAFVAMLFGVFIDLDHLFGLASYTQTNGVSSLFDFHSLMDPGGQWKSLLHSPVSVALVTPLSLASRLAIPLLFWAVHLSMDFVEQNYLGNFSPIEAGLLFLAGFWLVALRYGRFAIGKDRPTFSAYIRSELAEARGLFSRGTAAT